MMLEHNKVPWCKKFCSVILLNHRHHEFFTHSLSEQQMKLACSVKRVWASLRESASMVWCSDKGNVFLPR